MPRESKKTSHPKEPPMHTMPGGKKMADKDMPSKPMKKAMK